MIDNIIEAQNNEDDYQYLQWKQKRLIDYLLLGFQTALAFSPLLVTGSVWLYTRYVVSVLGHLPTPMMESCYECTLNSQYVALIEFTVFVFLASAILWFVSFIVLAFRKPGKRIFIPVAVFFLAWAISSACWTNAMTQVVEWWID